MKEKRKLIFRVGALLLVLLIAAAMMVTGRGHTVYFDNKTIEYNGQSCEAYQKMRGSRSFPSATEVWWRPWARNSA